MTRALAFALALAIPALSGCTGTAMAHADLPDAAPFDESVSDALYAQELDRTIAQLEPGRSALVVIGANWCHDSRALAGWLETPQFEDLLRREFEVVYVEAGVPQDGRGRNLDLAERYGITGIEGTPTVLVVGHTGELLNTPEDAKSWRNAASRSEAEIRATLEDYAARD